MKSATKRIEELERQKSKDTFNLRRCVNAYNGTFPAQCRESGFIFYNGTGIKIENFRKECRRQGFTFKVK